ncbi:MAG TPA: energy-coupling factor transporter transmembrane component T [Oscillospiraceae bacterium]|nr:energy-coupling factor transporter transmembrane component T [Oscillospiraceae bacterium]
MKNIFATYHPLVNFLYFVFIFGFSMVFMHPISLAISLICGFIYSVYLKGIKEIRFNFLFLLPTIIITALINPVFNHEGATVIAYLHTGNPLTFESIIYGIGASCMLAAIVCWFSCYNHIMTSDKFVYLFGKIIPAISLILSMALGFVPKFKSQIKIVSDARKTIGKDVSNGTLFERARHGITILSIMITWALENSIETADSMKGRGYGLPNRTAFSVYSFDKRDKRALTVISLLGIYILFGGIGGGLQWRYFPTMKGKLLEPFTISLWFSYLSLCLIPLVIEMRGERQWRVSQSKI